MGLTEKGYKRRTYQEILASKIALCKELFGEDIDVSDLTPLGKYLRINTYDQADTEELAELIYYAIFPNTATGTSLDRLCPFAGISRNPATAARYNVNVLGTTGTTVPIGFLVGTESGIQFYNTMESTIGDDGTCEISVECTEAGEIGNVIAEDITVIVNPAANVTSIVGSVRTTEGAETESDVALRKRFEAARSGLGSCNETSIMSALVRIEGITSAAVVVNEDSNTDSEGRPPHSFECYVAGDEDNIVQQQEIAKTIFDKKPLGIKTHGATSVTFEDDGGHSHTVNFSYVEDIEISVKLKVKVNTSYEGDTGNREIISNLTDYINGLGVGNSVVLSALYGQIHAVTGIMEVTELLLSTDGTSYSATNATISSYEAARFKEADIEVVIV